MKLNSLLVWSILQWGVWLSFCYKAKSKLAALCPSWALQRSGIDALAASPSMASALSGESRCCRTFSRSNATGSAVERIIGSDLHELP